MADRLKSKRSLVTTAFAPLDAAPPVDNDTEYVAMLSQRIPPVYGCPEHVCLHYYDTNGPSYRWLHQTATSCELSDGFANHAFRVKQSIEIDLKPITPNLSSDRGWLSCNAACRHKALLLLWASASSDTHLANDALRELVASRGHAPAAMIAIEMLAPKKEGIDTSTWLSYLGAACEIVERFQRGFVELPSP